MCRAFADGVVDKELAHRVFQKPSLLRTTVLNIVPTTTPTEYDAEVSESFAKLLLSLERSEPVRMLRKNQHRIVLTPEELWCTLQYRTNREMCKLNKKPSSKTSNKKAKPSPTTNDATRPAQSPNKKQIAPPGQSWFDSMNLGPDFEPSGGDEDGTSNDDAKQNKPILGCPLVPRLWTHQGTLAHRNSSAVLSTKSSKIWVRGDLRLHVKCRRKWVHVSRWTLNKKFCTQS